MPDFATITGVIGAVTGIIAIIVSIKNYVRVSAMKALDLRLELQKSFNNLDVVLSGVEAYLDFVHQSHMRVLAATGRNQSGEMKMFEDDFANDKARLRRLLGSQPRREANYERHTPGDLEKLVVSVHAFQGRVAELRGKYQKLFEADEDCRKEIRAEHRQ
ncbi:MAG: hypothetical protein A3G80_11855 [Betaproteobacteria bacterium RIFCSPLOWO2_12_FULL_62_13b]|nr:MAG: hypothetical protein A3G80_11855 [Betaproteobacteria bacterium RIFCSPLOWO2_12_FULL_62_13b]